MYNFYTCVGPTSRKCQHLSNRSSAKLHHRRLTFRNSLLASVVTGKVSPVTVLPMIATSSMPVSSNSSKSSTTSVPVVAFAYKQSGISLPMFSTSSSSANKIEKTVCMCDPKNCYTWTSFSSNTFVLSQSVKQKLKLLKSKLSVNKSHLTLQRRKRMCAPDSRTSSKTMGYVGTVVIVSLVGFVITMDAFKFVRKLYLREFWCIELA